MQHHTNEVEQAELTPEQQAMDPATLIMDTAIKAIQEGEVFKEYPPSSLIFRIKADQESELKTADIKFVHVDGDVREVEGVQVPTDGVVDSLKMLLSLFEEKGFFFNPDQMELLYELVDDSMFIDNLDSNHFIESMRDRFPGVTLDEAALYLAINMSKDSVEFTMSQYITWTPGADNVQVHDLTSISTSKKSRCFTVAEHNVYSFPKEI